MEKSPIDKETADKLAAQAEQLRLTMDTQGWKEIVQPVLDKMIVDVIGYKNKDGTWEAGATDFNKSWTPEMFIAYRQALMDFNNHLLSFLTEGERLRAHKENEERDPGFIMPMQDTRYSHIEPESRLELKREDEK